MQENMMLSLEKIDANLDSTVDSSDESNFVEFSCPQCFKNHKSAAVELQTPLTKFRCQRCETLFCFDWPATSPKGIQTLIVPETGPKIFSFFKGINKVAKTLDFTNQGEMLDTLPMALRRSSKIAKTIEEPKITFLDHWLYYRWKNKKFLDKVIALPWVQILDYGLWIVPGTLITIGIFIPAARSCIGIGASLIALRLGLVMLFR